MSKWMLALALLPLQPQALADGDDEQRWFKTEFTCAGQRYVVRNYCTVEADRAVNKRCDEQQLIINTKSGRKVVDLDAHQPDDDMLWVSEARCGASGKQQYVYFLFDNGGNCDRCEMSATIDSKGRWIQFGDKWMTDKATRQRLKRAQQAWFRAPAHRVTNKVVDESK